MTGANVRLSFVSGCIAALSCTVLSAQEHAHTPSVSGMPQGVPYFCANPTVTSTRPGNWSDPSTWSTRRVPAVQDKVAIAEGHRVVYDVVSDVALACVEVNGHLAFATGVTSRLKVGTVMVTEGGFLEIGSATAPVAPNVTAEIVIADQPIDPARDPAQIGNGIIGLGKVTMHGAIKTPTFIRLSREPLAGQTALGLEGPVTGWKVGDHLVIPDTRQIRAGDRVRSQTHAEKLQVAAVSGSQVTLAAPLAYDHKGGRNADGRLELLPHVGNVTRNVLIRSESPRGTRGHTMFISHANVDIRYVQFSDLGRTKPGILNNTDFDSQGVATRVGTNQIGRYALHFHHYFGPRDSPPNGHQFTVIGNAIDGASKWGITVHQSHYGLVQDNVVYNTTGAGIVTEDGTESFNVFDHNFSLRSAGSRQAALNLNTGYGQAGDPGGEGAAFWFRGPNNYIRNNVAANGDEFGFGLAPPPRGIVRTPVFKGANTSRASESKDLDTRTAAVLEFSNNEAYGATPVGVALGWNGTVSNFRAWHVSRHGVSASPSNFITIDTLTVRGDPSVLADPLENPVGVWFGDYASKNVVLRDANVEGTRVGVLSPFFYSQPSESGGGRNGSLLVDNGYFHTSIGVSIATAYSSSAQRGTPLKNAVVRDSVFKPLKLQAPGNVASETVSMNYGMTPNDPEPRDPILVYNYNKEVGNNFKIYYSRQAPQTVAPCHNTTSGIGGWVCPLDEAAPSRVVVREE